MRPLTAAVAVMICIASWIGSTVACAQSPAPSLPLKARELIVDSQLAIASKDILDEFDGKDLNPAWDWKLDRITSGWKKQIVGSKLVTKDIETPDETGLVRLRRPIALTGEFKVSVKFEWTSKDRSPETNTATQMLVVSLRDYAGNIIVFQGYIDDRVDNRGSAVGDIGVGNDVIDSQVNKYKQVATPGEFAYSLTPSGKAEITIDRDAQGNLVSTFNGGGKKQVITGTSTATVAEFEIEMRRFKPFGKEATFEGLTLDRVSVKGTSALQDKTTAKTIRDALLKSETERTDADKQLLASKGPRTLLTNNDFRVLLDSKPALKAQVDKVALPKLQKATATSQLKPSPKPPVMDVVTDLSLSPDGKKLAIAGGTVIALMDTGTGKIDKIPFKDPVTNVDNKQLVSAQYTSSGKLVVRQLVTMQGRESLDSILMRDMKTGVIQRVPISKEGFHTVLRRVPDDHYVATTNGVKFIHIYHVERGLVGGWIESYRPLSTFDISADQKYAAVGSERGHVLLLQMPTPEEMAAATIERGNDMKFVAELHGHSSAIWDVKFSPDGKRLATGDKSGLVLLWNVEQKEPYVGIEGTSVAFSPDSTKIVTFDGANDKKRLRGVVWDVATGKALHTMTGGHQFDKFPPFLACWDKTGKKIFTSEGKSIVTWNLPGKK